MSLWNQVRLNKVSDADQTHYAVWGNGLDVFHAVAYRLKTGRDLERAFDTEPRVQCHVLLDLIPSESLGGVLEDLTRISNPFLNPATYGLLGEPATAKRIIGKGKITRRMERPVFSLDGE